MHIHNRESPLLLQYYFSCALLLLCQCVPIMMQFSSFALLVFKCIPSLALCSSSSTKITLNYNVSLAPHHVLEHGNKHIISGQYSHHRRVDTLLPRQTRKYPKPWMKLGALKPCLPTSRSTTSLPSSVSYSCRSPKVIILRASEQ